MTFVEVHVNEEQSALEKLLRDAYSSIGFPDELPGFRFGRVIVWQGRMFQQVEIPLEFVGGEPAARIVEGGRCGGEYMVRPIHYSDYDRDA
jgi:hypothetical protein